MAKSISDRILVTPSSYAKKNLFYLQEIGTLTSTEPHISSRKNLSSFLFMVVTDGNGYLTYAGSRHQIKAGDCALINCQKGYSHESSAENPWTLMWVHFNGKDAEEYYTNYLSQNNTAIFHPRSFLIFTDVLSSLYQIQNQKSPHLEMMTNKLLVDIITLCFTENRTSLQENPSLSIKLQQIHAYLEEHYSEKITLEFLAEHFFISKFHLAREYRKAYGITINSDLTERRVSHAKSLLRFSDHSIENIATICGFQEVGYFIKVFKRAENLTPLSYRKKW